MMKRKGIILAGGTGSRLYPLTVGVSKQLLPVYDKPMIYYPLTVLMLAGISEILVITNPQDLSQFKRVLGNGSQWGIKLEYVSQPRADGIAQAFLLAEDFLAGAPSALILGDNIFFGHALSSLLKVATKNRTGATIFAYHVTQPQQYGIVGFDEKGTVTSIVEKPIQPASNYAITGLYFVDETAPERAKQVKPSARGELEITSILNSYKNDNILQVCTMGRGYSWFDMGTHADLIDAGNFVRTITSRQGLQVGSPDELAYKMGYTNKDKLMQVATTYGKTSYGEYLFSLINERQ